MRFFRAYIAPLLIVLTFLVAMVAVSARIFLPSDMMAPAPVEGIPAAASSPAPAAPATAETVPDVSALIHGQSALAS
jgi:hypothetical protein